MNPLAFFPERLLTLFGVGVISGYSAPTVANARPVPASERDTFGLCGPGYNRHPDTIAACGGFVTGTVARATYDLASGLTPPVRSGR
jgi:hypothetical protein